MDIIEVKLTRLQLAYLHFLTKKEGYECFALSDKDEEKWIDGVMWEGLAVFFDQKMKE